jgi:hypothetical protein
MKPIACALILVFNLCYLGTSSDSTKVKPNFRYKKMKMEVDSLDLKTKAIKEKLDSLKNKRGTSQLQ